MMRGLLVVASGLLALLVGVGVYSTLGGSEVSVRALGRLVDRPASDDRTPRTFVVDPGDTASEVASELQKEGFIQSALLFRALVELQGVGHHLEVGSYALSPNMTAAEIIAILSKGRATANRRLTVPEGWSASQIAVRLEQSYLMDKQAFRQAASRPEAIEALRSLAPEATTVEGYLFPDTYEVGPDGDASALIARMVRQFQRNLPAGFERRASELGLSVHQLVTLASIVEREAALPSERALIAGVFHNRLRRNMPLEADPTIQYAVAMQDPEEAARYGFWKNILELPDLQIDSPYNTYRFAGLPPGPICNPGVAALEAAAHPESTEMLFFVANGDRSHLFARTVDEHRANVERLRSSR